MKYKAIISSRNSFVQENIRSFVIYTLINSFTYSFQVSTVTHCCAKRSLRPWDSQNWVFRVFVRPFVRPSVRPSAIFEIFIEKNIGGTQMPPSSEVLKSRFQNFFAKSGRSVAIKAK